MSMFSAERRAGLPAAGKQAISERVQRAFDPGKVSTGQQKRRCGPVLLQESCGKLHDVLAKGRVAPWMGPHHLSWSWPAERGGSAKWPTADFLGLLDPSAGTLPRDAAVGPRAARLHRLGRLPEGALARHSGRCYPL